MPRWQLICLGVVALGAWAVFELVSIVANMRFAGTLGSSENEKEILKAVGVAADIVKAMIPIAALYFLRSRMWLALSATVVLGVTVFTFSILAAVGFMAKERMWAYHQAATDKSNTDTARKNVARLEREREWAPVVKPLRVLEAERANHRSDPLWAASKYCTQPTTTGQSSLCAVLRKLDLDIETAAAIKEQDAKIAAEQSKVEKGRSYGDAQIETLASIGGTERLWLIGLIVLGVLLIELGSGLGLTVALGLLTTPGSAVGRVVHEALGRVIPSAPSVDAVAKAIRDQHRGSQATLEAQMRARPKAAANFKSPVAPVSGGGLADLLTPIDMPKRVRGRVA
jgi:hypothetical protein